MKLLFSVLAMEELDDAANYLDLQYEGLGDSFREEIEAAAERIALHPHSWSIEAGEIRRCFVHRFPYKLLYSVEGNFALVIAVAHQHRRPDYWVDRTE